MKSLLNIPLRSDLTRRLTGELAATFLLMYMGFCVNCQTTLSRGQMNSQIGTIFGWGIALVFAVQLSFHTSGSHLNPAISFSAWIFGQLSFVDFCLYTLVQTIACFLGAALSFLHYYDKINEFDGGHRKVFGKNATAAIFATYPGDHLSVIGGIFDQIACTTILAIIVRIVTDEKNKIPKWIQPVLFGLMLTGISLGFGLNSGNAMNPSRDFGPRLFTLFTHGWEVFRCNGNYLWFVIPVFCPFIGALWGSWLYQLLIDFQTIDEEEQLPSSIPSSAPSATNLLSQSPKLQLHHHLV
ncbi:Major intrinsic protein domain containing protein [Aphelenchoides besseyi]|nr:Major intrinsic protein domain containing protein [Aphelenchoides besseyi]